jgi:hypothetical protein
MSFLKTHALLVVCIAIAFGSIGGVYWVNGEIETAKSVLQQKSDEGSRLAANVGNSLQLAEQLQQLNSAVAKVQTRYVRPNELATNLQYFYRLETESSVELIDLRQTTSGDSVKAKGSSRGVAFSISVKGDYNELLSWLRRLENGKHFCRIMSASTGVGADRGAPLILSVALELLGEP